MKKLPEKLSIKEWNEADRPREKMLSLGASALSNAELIAILIGSGNKEESAVQLSRRILHTVNDNLNNLAKRSIQQLTSTFKGIGEAKAVTISAALELGKRREFTEKEQRSQIRCSQDIYNTLQAQLRDLPYEELWVILTNPSNMILKKLKISQGGINSTSADIRLILKAALLESATGIFLCHNHPSGNIQPSKQDNDLTSKVFKAAQIMNIRLLDHIILTDGNYFSYADEGVLQ